MAVLLDRLFSPAVRGECTEALSEIYRFSDLENFRAFGVPNQILRDTGTELFKTKKQALMGSLSRVQIPFITAFAKQMERPPPSVCVAARCEVTEGCKITHTAYSHMLPRGVQNKHSAFLVH
jgi:hypothetical protein